MLKRLDYILIFVVCVVLGVFVINHVNAGTQLKKLTQPENSAVLAVEVAKLEKNNADLRHEVRKLTKDLETYGSSNESEKKLREQYISDNERLDLMNGLVGKSGQGIVATIEGKMTTAQVVDLVNAIKNIGADQLSINGERIVINTDLSRFANQSRYEIQVLGNGRLLKSAMERKGGIVEQISTKDLNIVITERDVVTIGPGEPLKLRNSKMLIER
ncbi:MAG TPA: DUF881 domain-containing protein [bacterium]|nr:DUF881 domain-containing protein [bacterium]